MTSLEAYKAAMKASGDIARPSPFVLRPKTRKLELQPGYMFVGMYLVPSPRRIFIREVQERVAEHYGLPVRIMDEGSRFRAHARPRQVAMYLAKRFTTKSLPEIGRAFGGRDHTTIIHGIRQIEKLRREDGEVQYALRRVSEQLEGLS